GVLVGDLGNEPPVLLEPEAVPIPSDDEDLLVWSLDRVQQFEDVPSSGRGRRGIVHFDLLIPEEMCRIREPPGHSDEDFLDRVSAGTALRFPTEMPLGFPSRIGGE